MKTVDLLKIVDQNKEFLKDIKIPPLPKFSNDVERFIRELKINEGAITIHRDRVYAGYKTWAQRPLNANAFYKVFSQFFKETDENYKLNYKPVQLINAADNLRKKKYEK